MGSDITRWYWEKSDAILGLKEFTCQLKRQTHHWPRFIHSVIYRINRFPEHLLCAWDTVLSCPHGACSLVRDKKKAKSEVAQSCLTLCDPMDCSLPGSSIHGISRQEYWSGLPFPSSGDLPDPGIEAGSLALQGRLFTIWATREAQWKIETVLLVRSAPVILC